MARGKTNYTFTVNAPEQAIHNLMQNFLSANGYQPNNEAGVVYYKYYDGIWGNRFQDYKGRLVPLFNAINELNVNGGMAQPMYNAPYTNTQANQFAADVDKSKEKMAIAGFIISIVGLVLSCFGIYFGAIIIALEIYFAVSGLKTSKKGFSIATFVISGISILIIIAEVILAVMLQ